MKIGIYNRYWNVYGGGEKYIGAIAEVLSNDHDVELISVEHVNWNQIQSHLRLNLSQCSTIQWPDESCYKLAPLSSQYDLFINSTYQSSMRPYSARSVLICFFPHQVNDISQLKSNSLEWIKKPLRKLKRSVFSHKPNHQDTSEFCDASLAAIRKYDRIISISQFTSEWIEKRWHLPSTLLPPPIDTNELAFSYPHAKEKIILSVGRFFAGGHNKKHHEMARAFIKMRSQERIPQDWRLVFIGSRHLEHPEHLSYFEKLKEICADYPIDIFPDMPFLELRRYYSKAAIYWHATGWGEDIDKHPERFEHFGITTCEAMANRCVPIVFDAAGQREIVDSSETGFRYSNYNEMAQHMEALTHMPTSEILEMGNKSRSAILRYASSEFPDRVKKAFSGL